MKLFKRLYVIFVLGLSFVIREKLFKDLEEWDRKIIVWEVGSGYSNVFLKEVGDDNRGCFVKV